MNESINLRLRVQCYSVKGKSPEEYRKDDEKTRMKRTQGNMRDRNLNAFRISYKKQLSSVLYKPPPSYHKLIYMIRLEILARTTCLFKMSRTQI